MKKSLLKSMLKPTAQKFAGYQTTIYYRHILWNRDK